MKCKQIWLNKLMLYIYILFFEKLISTNVYYTLLYSVHTDRNNLLLFWIRNRILYFFKYSYYNYVCAAGEACITRFVCLTRAVSRQILLGILHRFTDVLFEILNQSFSRIFFIHNIMNGFRAYKMYCTLVIGSFSATI